MTTSSDDMDFERSSSPEILSESEEVPDTFDYVRGNSRSSTIFSLYRKYFDISPKCPISPDLEANIEDFSESIKISNVSEKNEVKLEENDGSSSLKEGDNISIEGNCSSDGEGKSPSFKTKENENHSVIELYAHWKYAELWMLDRCTETPQERYLKNNSNAKFLTFEEFQKEEIKQFIQDILTKMNSESEEKDFKRSVQLPSHIAMEKGCFSIESYEEFEVINMIKDLEAQQNRPGAPKNNSKTEYGQMGSNILWKTIFKRMIQDLKNLDQNVSQRNSDLCEHRCEFNEDFLVNMIKEPSIHNASMKTKNSKNEHPTKITNSLAESSPKKKNPADENGKVCSKNSHNSFKKKIAKLAILIFVLLSKSTEFISKVYMAYNQSAEVFWLGFLLGVCCCVLLYFLLNLKDNEVGNNKSSDA